MIDLSDFNSHQRWLLVEAIKTSIYDLSKDMANNSTLTHIVTRASDIIELNEMRRTLEAYNKEFDKGDEA